ncbi:acyltransferase family protein [Bacillus sp. REN10]|uniref:acyltransferase family protein n=1 Tax=Bacillus sp. REN10 TaxID=2782541 RepID=UPI0023AF1D34|nr:acyltransferase family protein [Bacillus sp. REN10]
MRSLACLSILLLHVLDRVYMHENDAVNMISVLLTFGTPTFVFISEFVLSYSYKGEVPRSFWQNRIKYIFLPYLFFGSFYAFAKAFEQAGLSDALPATFFHLLWRHILLGDYHGYFILIIFQFYALHLIFIKYFQQTDPRKVIGLSLCINLAYLAFFNFVPPLPIPFADYIWAQYYWVPFAGWLFYFSLAFYSGRYYESFKQLVLTYRHWATISVIIFGAIAITLYNLEVLPVASSKRVDMLFFTTSMILFLYSIAMRLPRVPAFFVWVSKYSFGIYLFHPFFLAIFASLRGLWGWIPPLVAVPVLFFATIILSVGAVYIVNKLPFGAYLVGKVGISNKPSKSFAPIEKTTMKAQ